MSKIKVAGIVNDSITDGPGLRYTLFMQGCLRGCKDCHNPQSHDINGGKYMDDSEIFNQIKKNPIISGVTFSGGEPFLQAGSLINLAQMIKNEGLELAAYTGYKFEELMSLDNKDILDLLKLCDVLVDGEFLKDEKSLELKFKGSKNQRIIDVKKSLNGNKIVLKEDGRWN